eukprot:TRINITY_DN1802_c0_g1_i5.p1 TRINITY_DN1802_c0_g1~~TRINITY_DN1802_c0_g1_i5.p1  ORF type:complete len:175 (-),score=33.79 TRINITY_DN1802_c0_g1_i5:375-899(-)
MSQKGRSEVMCATPAKQRETRKAGRKLPPKLQVSLFSSTAPTNDNSPTLSNEEHHLKSKSKANGAVKAPLKKPECRDDPSLTLEIDVCPRRKKFTNAKEREAFVQDYKRKYKTEMCKNWEFKGTCKWGDKVDHILHCHSDVIFSARMLMERKNCKKRNISILIIGQSNADSSIV